MNANFNALLIYSIMFCKLYIKTVDPDIRKKTADNTAICKIAWG
jgi:hypothetical protein